LGSTLELCSAFFIAAYIIGEFKIGNTIAKTVNEILSPSKLYFQVLLRQLPGTFYLVVWDSFIIITYIDRRIL
jgi:hypothetical protein